MATALIYLTMGAAKRRQTPDVATQQTEPTSKTDIACNTLAAGGVLGSFACPPLLVLALPKACQLLRKTPDALRAIRKRVLGSPEERMAIVQTAPRKLSYSVELTQPKNEQPDEAK